MQLVFSILLLRSLVDHQVRRNAMWLTRHHDEGHTCTTDGIEGQMESFETVMTVTWHRTRSPPLSDTPVCVSVVT